MTSGMRRVESDAYVCEACGKRYVVPSLAVDCAARDTAPRVRVA